MRDYYSEIFPIRGYYMPLKQYQLCINLFLISFLLLPCYSMANVYSLQNINTEVIGDVKVVYSRKEDTLIDIARRYGLGYDEIVHANPGIDRWSPGGGTPIVLPLQHILPDTPREGIVLNVPEMRLYYYPVSELGTAKLVYTYPVSIGRIHWQTPLGITKIISKEIDPPWKPPASIRAEHANNGDYLPEIVPGGPTNPLGRFAMRLGVAGYLIHGTDKPYGIGMQVTHGCIRMYPEDIEQLFNIVPIGTPVRLIDQPVKVGWLNGELLLEAHQALEEDESPIKLTLAQIQKAVTTRTGPQMAGVDQAVLQAAIDQISGIPVSISTTITSNYYIPILSMNKMITINNKHPSYMKDHTAMIPITNSYSINPQHNQIASENYLLPKRNTRPAVPVDIPAYRKQGRQLPVEAIY